MALFYKQHSIHRVRARTCTCAKKFTLERLFFHSERKHSLSIIKELFVAPPSRAARHDPQI